MSRPFLNFSANEYSRNFQNALVGGGWVGGWGQWTRLLLTRGLEDS